MVGAYWVDHFLPVCGYVSIVLPVNLSSLDGAAADFLGRLRNGILDGARYTGHVYYRSHLFFSSSSQPLCPGMYPNTLAASGKAARASQDFFLTGNRPAMSSDEATNSHRVQSSHFSSPYPSFFLRSFPSTRYSPHDPQSLSAHARAMYLCKYSLQEVTTPHPDPEPVTAILPLYPTFSIWKSITRDRLLRHSTLGYICLFQSILFFDLIPQSPPKNARGGISTYLFRNIYRSSLTCKLYGCSPGSMSPMIYYLYSGNPVSVGKKGNGNTYQLYTQ